MLVLSLRPAGKLALRYSLSSAVRFNREGNLGYRVVRSFFPVFAPGSLAGAFNNPTLLDR